MITKDLEENAKNDWFDLVKKHKRKQKGITTLNPNAGDVEKNIELFNTMQPTGSITVDSANGNVTADGSCCESAQTTKQEILDDEFDMSMRTLL